MQAILILTVIGTLLLLPGSSIAETNAECVTRCDAEKATREAACPPAGKDDETDQANARCMLESENAYDTCVNECPQPTSTES